MADFEQLKELNQLRQFGVADEYTKKIDGKEVLKVKFQVGGTADNPRNGVFIEDLLSLAYAKLSEYNSKFPSRENSLALTKIEESILWLTARKVERENRGVYGKDIK